jgi:hypothetical protein
MGDAALKHCSTQSPANTRAFPQPVQAWPFHRTSRWEDMTSVAEAQELCCLSGMPEGMPSHKTTDETRRWTPVVSHPCAQNAQGWGTRRHTSWDTDSESVPFHKTTDETRRWTPVVSHPCAQNAQGWGTRPHECPRHTSCDADSESVPFHKTTDETRRWTPVVSHPCAQNAQGWGTPRHTSKSRGQECPRHTSVRATGVATQTLMAGPSTKPLMRPSGGLPWYPTLAHRTRKDGAPGLWFPGCNADSVARKETGWQGTWQRSYECRR